MLAFAGFAVAFLWEAKKRRQDDPQRWYRDDWLDGAPKGRSETKPRRKQYLTGPE